MGYRQRIVQSVLLMLMIMLLPAAVIAQEEFTSERVVSQGVSMFIPPSWVFDVSEPGFLRFASNASALQAVLDETGDFSPGDVAITIATPELLDLLGLETTAAPLDTLERFLVAFAATGTPERSTGVFFVPAAVVEASGRNIPGGQATVYALAFRNGTILVVVQSGTPEDAVTPLMADILSFIYYDPMLADEVPQPAAGSTSQANGMTADFVGTGTLRSTAPGQLWVGNFGAGDQLTAWVIADDDSFDPVLAIYDDAGFMTGQPLATNDNSGDPAIGADSPRIEAFDIVTGGDYGFMVSGANGEAAGGYTLYVEGRGFVDMELVPDSYVIMFFASQQPAAAPTAAGPQGELFVGSGELTADETIQVWAITANSSASLTAWVIAENDSFDPTLAFHDEASFLAGTPLFYNDDSRDETIGRFNPRLEATNLDVVGDYIFVVSSFTGRGTGRYTLHVQGGNVLDLQLIPASVLQNYLATAGISQPQSPAPTVTPGATGSNNQASTADFVGTGALTASEPVQLWGGNFGAGDQLTAWVIATNGSFDPVLELYDEASFFAGTPLAINDDSGDPGIGALNPRIEAIDLNTGGDYAFLVRSFSGAGTGEYQIFVDGRGIVELELLPANVTQMLLQQMGTGVNPSNTSEDLDDGLLRQWASAATGTSQVTDTSWSFNQATGAPNAQDGCRHNTNSWSSQAITDSEVLALEYDEAVFPTQINIYMNMGLGSIVFVEVGSSETGRIFQLPNSEDVEGNTPCPGVFTIDITTVNEAVDRVLIYMDMARINNYTEIDAVQLVGIPFGEVSSIPSSAATAVASNVLDYNLPAIFGYMTLRAGFTPDPFSFPVMAGGDIRADTVRATNGDICYGHTTAEPTFSIIWEGNASFLRFYVEANHDLTMVINAPDASWHCNDDTFGLLPAIDFSAPATGRYDIWLGTFRPGERVNTDLLISERSTSRPNPGA
ncbi:hypothetical protein FBR02_04445 [Anaerolineae bacterium CFX9]|nr:hypothetical protein [Anaerolineae bacterium CFX9]